MTDPVDENRNGATVDPARRAADSAARRFTRGPATQRALIGAGALGLGAMLFVAVRSIYGITEFIVTWGTHPQALTSLVAWVLLIAVLISVFVTTRLTGDRLPDGLFTIFLLGLGLSAGLDLVAVWDRHDAADAATATWAAASALLAGVTLRRTQEVVVATAIGGSALLAAALLNRPAGEVSPEWATAQLSAVILSLLPVVIGMAIAEDFTRMVQFELDRALVSSTVQTPRFAIGMLASEELARLDLAAENLFESVADGTTALPLDARTSSTAASLATELRLHLIEGRRETWLYHAISESSMLGRTVTLSDRSSLAGLLDTSQRDGLLATVWLLLTDQGATRGDRRIEIEISPVNPDATGVPGRKVCVPIRLRVTGIQRNRVDPAIWDAIERVGRYADTHRASVLQVDIECHVDNPAEA